MTYVRVDDNFPDHPKVLEIGPLGEALWLRGLCYASRNQTDGAIPRGFVLRMGDLDGSALAGALVKSGLWDETDSGWQVHGYTDWQRSKAEIEDISAKRSVAGSKGGKQKASNLLERSSDLPQQRSSKSYPDTDTDTDTDTEKGDTPPIPPAPKTEQPPPVKIESARTANPAWSMLEVLCDELGQDATALSKPSRDKQLAAAKRLAGSGFSEADLRSMVRWLAPQPWVSSGVDLFLIEKQRGKWELAGKPDHPPDHRQLPAIRAPNGRDIGYSTDELIAMGRQGSTG